MQLRFLRKLHSHNLAFANCPNILYNDKRAIPRSLASHIHGAPWNRKRTNYFRNCQADNSTFNRSHHANNGKWHYHGFLQQNIIRTLHGAEASSYTEHHVSNHRYQPILSTKHRSIPLRPITTYAIRGWELYIIHLGLSIFHLDLYHANHHTLHWHLVSGVSRTRPKRRFSSYCKLLNSADDSNLTASSGL